MDSIGMETKTIKEEDKWEKKSTYGRGGGQGGHQAHLCMILVQPKLEAFDLVNNGSILTCAHMASIFFYPCSTFSYVSVKFSLG